MECIELSFREVIHKPRNNAAAMGWLAAVALLGLMLWLSPAASVSAQSIPPTSPCPVGGSSVPPGWIPTITPDCSDTTKWYASTGGTTNPWILGDVPVTPSGHTTFMSIGGSNVNGDVRLEALSTTITGLQPGNAYFVNIYFNGNRPNGFNPCPGTVVINGVSTAYPAASGNTWDLRRFRFVAAGATAAFTIQVQTAGVICLGNIYVANVEAEIVDADVQVIKAVSPSGAVASGSALTYTLVATNGGPSAATSVLLRDTPSAGLNCTTPSPTATCSASGGASCPGATVPVSSLTGGGVAIPSLPVGGQVAVTMQCTVTATGR